MEGWTGCGSTGEFAAMIAAQRRMVVEIVVDWTAERVPVAAATAFIANGDSECKAFAAAPIPLNGDPDPVVTVGFDFAAGCYRFSQPCAITRSGLSRRLATSSARAASST